MSRDFITAVVLIFVLAITVLVSGFVWNKMTLGLANTTIANTTGVSLALEDVAAKAPSRFDNVFFFGLIGLMLGIVVAGYYIPADGLFIGVYIVLLIAAMVISPFIGDGWQMMVSNDALSDFASLYPKTNFVLGNLPVWVMVTGITSIIITFAKGRGGGR